MNPTTTEGTATMTTTYADLVAKHVSGRYQVMADGLWECRTCGCGIECVECGHDMHRYHRTDDTTHECTGCAICAEARSAVA